MDQYKLGLLTFPHNMKPNQCISGNPLKQKSPCIKMRRLACMRKF